MGDAGVSFQLDPAQRPSRASVFAAARQAMNAANDEGYQLAGRQVFHFGGETLIRHEGDRPYFEIDSESDADSEISWDESAPAQIPNLDGDLHLLPQERPAFRGVPDGEALFKGGDLKEGGLHTFMEGVSDLDFDARYALIRVCRGQADDPEPPLNLWHIQDDGTMVHVNGSHRFKMLTGMGQEH
eukprot:gnl/MRDRNA2_/MRDRNA2_57386_c0_seq1.p1 gnl/MRDRNA2_/MRDRNA2_57386_c0~~gnl/MRDRNA2_/MRDRNA2_57386_c0_seq1.p1  ORF type:complete len:185 (+),score=40.91 gnl/MRDRNA2_/MRDRNA2_57386_c0_seq1:106-660(+)